MRQKDKKQRQRYRGRLQNISLPELDILDENPELDDFKTARTADKLADSYKTDAILKEGRVLEVMSNYLCQVELEGEEITASISGRLKQFLYRSQGIIAVGDRVKVDIEPAPDYRIEKLLPRKNSLIRYTGGSFQRQIIIAANMDQIVITSSWRMPRFKAGLVDRYLIIAAKHGIKPILVMNKIDLCEDFEELEESIEYYRKIGVEIVLCSALTGEGIEDLRKLLKGKDSVFSGHSGAGKSSLINALEPGLELFTQEVSDFNEKGRHTTTASTLIPWSFGGHLVDTPGIKTISLHQSYTQFIPQLFPGFERYHPLCKFRDCSHTHEDDCAVIKAVEEDEIHIERYDSYLGIMASP